MNRNWFTLLGMGLAVLLIAACAGPELTPPATPLPPEAEESPVAMNGAAVEDAEVLLVEDDDPPEPLLPIATPQVDTTCLNCHTDVELLRELGEEEEVIKLSEGKG
jgi:hypothetical protein